MTRMQELGKIKAELSLADERVQAAEARARRAVAASSTEAMGIERDNAQVWFCPSGAVVF